IDIRDAGTLRVLYHIPDMLFVAFTSDGRMLAVGADGRGGVYDYRTARFVGTPQPIPDAGDVSDETQDPTTGHVAVGYNDGSVRVLDLSAHVVAPIGIRLGDTATQSTQVHGLSFSPDGRVLVAGVQDEKTYILDA